MGLRPAPREVNPAVLENNLKSRMVKFRGVKLLLILGTSRNVRVLQGLRLAEEWGCRWWSHWIQNIETAFRSGAELEV